MNNMGFFSKLGRDRPAAFTLYSLEYKGKEELQIIAFIFNFESFLDTFLDNPTIQKFWNDIKEKFGKDIDEKELLKVFKFYTFINLLGVSLESTGKSMSSLNAISSKWGYNIYSDKKYFNGKLDKKTFKELIRKMWEYLGREFYTIYEKNEEQKDEQPK